MSLSNDADKMIPIPMDGTQVQKTAVWLVSQMPLGLDIAGRRYHQLFTLSFGVLALEMMGELGNISVETRSAWADMIREFQDIPGGAFGLSGHKLRPAGVLGEGHRALVGSFFACQALLALGEKARRRVEFLAWLESETSVDAWLDGLDWSNARLASEAVMAVLGLLIYRFWAEQDANAPVLYHAILDRLEALQDPKTGLWGMQSGDSMEHALIAGFCIFPFFNYVHRPILQVSRIVDCAFHLLLSNKTLFSQGCAGLYAGVAAINLLALFETRLNYRRVEISHLLAEIQRELAACPDPDDMISRCESGMTGPFGLQWLDETPGRDDVLYSLIHQVGLVATRRTTRETNAKLSRPDIPVYGSNFQADLKKIHLQIVLPWLRPFQNQGSVRLFDPQVSVIIPVYNQGIFLHESVQSVLNQTFRDYELIIVNDGSTDEFTNLIIDHLNLPEARVIQQENLGLAAARNTGIRQARGNYICCLDADDRLRPDYFARAVPHLERDPGIGIVTGLLETFDEMSGVHRYHEFEFDDLLAENQIIEPALYRKEAWEKAGGYCETFSHSGIEDWDLWIGIYEAGYRAFFVDEVLYDYRIRADAMSAGMFQPGIWEQMSAELVQRHSGAYTTHFIQVIQKLNVRWVEMKNWVKSREQAVAWWERQSGTWQYIAARNDGEIQRLQTRIHELQSQHNSAAGNVSTSIPAELPACASESGAHGTTSSPVRSGLVNILYQWWLRFGRRLGFIGKDWKA